MIIKKILSLFPVFEIKTPEDEVYIRRYTILKLFGFKIMVHHILLPDYADHNHNHPWRFLTVILKNGYWESNNETGLEFREPFRIYYHGLDFQHRITNLPYGPAWTLVFRGRRQRQWGFITECGWKHWQYYVNKAYNYLPICEEEDSKTN